MGSQSDWSTMKSAADFLTELNIPYEKSLPLTNELRYFTDRLDGSPIKIANSQSAIEVMKILEKATLSLLKRNK